MVHVSVKSFCEVGSSWFNVPLICVLYQAKMKAAQERFVVSCKPTEESSGLGEGDEAEAKRPKESGPGRDELYEDVQVTHCALCRDAASTSPLCFLVLIQVVLVLFCVSCLHLDIL